jgi:ABC-type multidrug transport system fused ATPase/permease subunit
MQLVQLQLTIIARPFIGGIGFLLVVPVIGFAIEPADISNPQLAFLVSLLPEIRSLGVVLLVFFCIMLLNAALGYWQDVTSEAIEQKMLAGIRRDIYHAAMNANVTVIGRYHQADYTRTIIDEAETVTSTFDQLIDLVTLGFTLLIYTGICFYLSPGITAIAVILGMVLLLATVPLQGLIRRVGSKHLEASETLYRRASDQVKGIKHIKSSNTAQHHTTIFHAAIKSLSREELRYTSVTSLTQLVYSISSALVFCILAYLLMDVVNAELALVVILALVFSRIMPQVNRLRTIIQRIAYLKPRLEELYLRLELLNVHVDPPYVPIEFNLRDGIQLTNVSYQYPESDNWALRHFSATLAPNQLVALTGTSGIGKSTLADILSGLVLPQEGEFTVGGTLIDSRSQIAWRGLVNYVPQTPFLIESSIRDNMNLLRRKPAEDVELRAVLEQAAADFVFELPAQLDTVIGDDGITLSVGERQRLEFARSLLGQRPVMILDETTSNLDPDNEAKVIATLQSLKHSRLIIIISHRPSVAVAADLIIAINDNIKGQ